MRLTTTFIVFLIALPGAVFAHATPVESTPASGSQFSEAPQEVTIRFSERLEKGSSRIKVADTDGAEVIAGESEVSPDSPYILSVPLTTLDEGVYIASWSVVSSDDGHFTKGSFAFSVGSSTVSSSASDSIVVQITGYKEASAMFVEFLGNSLLWGALVMLILFRSTLREVRFSLDAPRARAIFTYLIYGGVVLGIVGGAAQLVIKTKELAQLHEVIFSDAFAMYAATSAGSSTIFRMAAFAAFAAIFIFVRVRIFTPRRLGAWELPLFGCLLVFAYFRALISHATANPFYPELSIGVNILHLIEKDLWPGVLLILLAFMLYTGRTLTEAFIPRVLALLSANLVALVLTASYIVWLHLKDFENIGATLWGENFLHLLVPAFALVGFHAYHALSSRYAPRMFARYFTFSIAAETGAALLVVFFTSLVIITSPPLHHAEPKEFSARGQGVLIELRKSPFEDSQALLTVEGKEPIVLIGEADGGLQVSLTKRFDGGYVFPLALIEGKDTNVNIIVPQESGYDARAVFRIARDDFDVPDGHGRTFDFFTIIMMGIALSGLVFALWLSYISKRDGQKEMDYGSRHIALVASGIGLSVLAILLMIHAALALFGNDFKRQCLADKNQWHLMVPIRAGIPVSETPQEGCMLQSGTYHFPDEREYNYLRALGEANVTMARSPEAILAGKEAALTFALTERDGSPAKLSIEHEKILHVIIVSEDMSHFAHIHADDDGPVPQGDLNESRFTVRHTFPKAGKYVVAVDYLHGLTHESKRFVVDVSGAPTQSPEVDTFRSPGVFGGHEVSFEYVPPVLNDIATLRYTVRKNGELVTDMEPYLAAAMHVAIVKNDLSEFIHTHGEVHPPGYVTPATITHNHVPPPARFGPVVEAHAVFPSPGLYTIFGEFKREGLVIPSVFTLRIE